MRLIFKIKLLIYITVSIIIVASFIYGYKKVKSFLVNLFSKSSISSSPILQNQSGGGFNSSGGSSW